MAENGNWFDDLWEWIFGAPGSVETISSLNKQQNWVNSQLGRQLLGRLGGITAPTTRSPLQGSLDDRSGASNPLSQALGGSNQAAFSNLEPLANQYMQSVLGGGAYNELQGITGGSAYSGLQTPTPQSIRGYGTMGLNAINTANQAILGREGQRMQAILGREGQRLGGVGIAQNLWREPYELALQYLGIPMLASYMEEPRSGILGDVIGAGAGLFAGK